MLALRLLGSPSATLDGEQLNERLLKKDLAVLYYLAATGQPQPRSLLIPLLWGEFNETDARANLRKALSGLHRRLGDLLVIERDQVQLMQAQCAVDLWEFERLAGRGLAASNVAQLQQAASLYRGDFLAGFAVHNAPDYDRWVYEWQERLRDLAVQVFALLSLLHVNAGELEPAIAAQRNILVLEPWREEAHRELMLLLAQSGQRSAALNQYKQCVEVLAAELGAPPGAETSVLAERIRAGLIPAPPPRAGNLPAGSPLVYLHSHLAPEMAPIVGRGRELDELMALLADGSCRSVTILGMGGIGKTRLALALAHRLQEGGAHVAMVLLAAEGEAGDILPAVGRAFGLAAGGGDDAILDALRADGEDLLLVLDSFEHLLPDGVEVLEQLLSRVPNLRCVVTSRVALSTRWEWRYPLAELGFPLESSAANPAAFSSVQLFLQNARRLRPRQPISGDELGAVMRICRLVGGLPLGIELAAAQLGSLACTAIADRLAASLDRLAADLHDLPVRQRSLEAIFDSSWATLPPQEQAVLARLSVIHGEWTLEAGLSIGSAAIPELMHLVDASLVSVSSKDLYSLHEVIKQFAARKLGRMAGAATAALAAYHDYYVAWAEQDMQAERSSRLWMQQAARQEHHLQHLWHIWLTRTDQDDRSRLAVTLLHAERTWRSPIVSSTGTIHSWDNVDAFLRMYTESAVAYSGVFAVDVAWLPWLADQLVDLASVVPQAQLDGWISEIAALCCAGEKVLALPIGPEFGLLYCRGDLLHKYGFDAPPRTWEELERMAAVIQSGQRAAGRQNFWGFVWPGRQPEGLTCTALEWQHSEGGGCILEADGCISVANPQAAAALDRAARWVGTISPPDFNEWTELTTQNAWENDGAAFMRMWSVYPYTLLQEPLRSATTVTVLPRGSARHAATLGGWPLVVHRSVRQQQEAYSLIREIASPAAQPARQRWDKTRLPVNLDLWQDPEILAIYSHLPEIHQLVASGGLAVRPIRVAHKLYGEVSTLYAKAVTAILSGRQKAAPALAELAHTLQDAGGWPLSA